MTLAVYLTYYITYHTEAFDLLALLNVLQSVRLKDSRNPN